MKTTYGLCTSPPDEIIPVHAPRGVGPSENSDGSCSTFKPVSFD